MMSLVTSHAKGSAACIIQACNTFLGLPESLVLLCALASQSSFIEENHNYFAWMRLLKIQPLFKFF